MRLKLLCFIGLCSCASFIYGAATIKYRIFPYNHLKTLTHSNNTVPRKSIYHQIKKSFFESQARKAEFVMIGDSLTDYGEWVELFPQHKIINRGIDGDTTFGIADRMDSIYSSHAQKAFIMAGINDFIWGQSVDDVFKRYQFIISGLIENNIKPYVQSTLLVGGSRNQLNEKIHSLNDKLENYCKKQQLVFIDLNQHLSEKGILNPDYTMDDVHLNGKGYKIWSNAISAFLR